MNTIGQHEINPWRDRYGNVVGASVFLSPDELEELEDTGEVVIREEE